MPSRISLLSSRPCPRAALCAAAMIALSVPAAEATDLSVSGTITEQFIQGAFSGPNGLAVTANDVFAGDIAGEGVAHIFSAEIVDWSVPTVENVVSRRDVKTADGNLYFEEVGSRHGDDVSVTSTIVRGTGMYKGATGVLTLTGVHNATGVDFTYQGVITLPD